MSTIRSREDLTRELNNKEIRIFFVSDHINVGIPLQVRALREQREWTQKELAQRAGMKQEIISAIENPNYKKAFTLSTLIRLASAFDVALIVRFAPISELVKWELDLTPEKLEAVSFEEDLYFKPQAITMPGHSGILLGGSASLESGGIQKESAETMKMGKLLDFKVRQKITDNKMDVYQKELDMPLHYSMAEGIRQ